MVTRRKEAHFKTAPLASMTWMALVGEQVRDAAGKHDGELIVALLRQGNGDRLVGHEEVPGKLEPALSRCYRALVRRGGGTTNAARFGAVRSSCRAMLPQTMSHSW